MSRAFTGKVRPRPLRERYRSINDRLGEFARNYGLFRGKPSETSRPGRWSDSVTLPPCIRATARTRDRPRPLPGVDRLGSSREKRSKACSRKSSGMPGPWSVTVSTAQWGSPWARIVSVPEPGRVLDRVVDQVRQGLRDQVRVATEGYRL